MKSVIKSFLKHNVYKKMSSSVIIIAINILSKNDKIKMAAVLFIQIFLALFDLVGVVLFGILGSLTISGIGSKKPGDRISKVLEFMHISSSSLQHQVTYLGIIVAVVFLLKTLSSLYLNKKTLYFLSRRAADLSSILTSKLLSQSLTQVQAKSVQETIYSLVNGPVIVIVGIIGGVISLLSDAALLIILIFGLFYVDKMIAILTIILFSSIGYILYYLLKVKVKQFGILSSQNSIETAEKINEALVTYREIFVRNRRSFYSQEIKNLKFKGAKLEADNTFYQGISKYVIEVTVIFGALSISGIQFFTQTAEHAVAVLGIFLATSARIAPAVLRMQHGFLGLTSNIGASAPTIELIIKLKKVQAYKYKESSIDFEHFGFNPDISIINVSKTYPTKITPAVSGVSLNIKKGELISIVGSSGAGKTTLIDLLLGVLSSDSGEIKISGSKPIEAIIRWEGAIAYVPQDVAIINGTIRENIMMGYPKSIYADTEIQKAIKIAKLDEFINQLPEGLDTPVGERGTKISGGQRQRLGIARAMFTNPSLLILDEATSSLDAITEADINESIQRMRGIVTVVVIAHRLSTVRNSNLVIYMDEGKILATGSFEEVRTKIPNFDTQAKLMGL